MSYAVTGYKFRSGESELDVARRLNGAIQEDEDYDGDVLTSEEKEKIARVLSDSGLERVAGLQYQTFKMGVLEVMIFDTQVSISAPYWESARGDMQSGLKIALELTKVAPIHFWDPQKGCFLSADDVSGRQFDHGLKTVEWIKKREDRPWWKFW